MGRRHDATGERFGKLVAISFNYEKRKWLCQCDCGSLPKLIRWSSLQQGFTNSCGCLYGQNRIKDLSGQRFGKLLAIKYINKSRWLCKCDCGKEKEIDGRSLTSKDTQSCGCAKSDWALLDLKGQKFGRLTAVERVRKNNSSSTGWKCICDCGNERIVSTISLTSGKSKSCGCYRKELYNIPKHKSKNPAIRKVITCGYKNHSRKSKKNNIKWLLSDEEAEKMLLDKCFYCLREPFRIAKEGKHTALVNGIDRIDNTKDYTLDNVVTACEQCNKSKRMLTQKEFKDWIELIYKNYVLQDR